MGRRLRRPVATLLLCLLLGPGEALAQAESEDLEEEEATPRKKSKSSRPKTAPVAETKSPASEESDEGFELDLSFITKKPSRYGFVGSGLFLVGGAGFIYLAQGEAKRAETTAAARQAARNLEAARASSAMANAMIGLAVLSAGYALVMELLPTQKQDKSPVTFHF